QNRVPSRLLPSFEALPEPQVFRKVLAADVHLGSTLADGPVGVSSQQLSGGCARRQVGVVRGNLEALGPEQSAVTAADAVERDPAGFRPAVEPRGDDFVRG